MGARQQPRAQGNNRPRPMATRRNPHPVPRDRFHSPPMSIRSSLWVDDDLQDSEREECNEWRPYRYRNDRDQPRRREAEQDGIGRIKVKIPAFDGKCDPDVYLDRETKIEQIWSCHNFSEDKKVQLAALEFAGYAMVWWDSVVKARRQAMDPPFATWNQMRAMMRTRFIPRHHNRVLRNRLENMRQGALSVEKVYNNMQIAMARATSLRMKKPRWPAIKVERQFKSSYNQQHRSAPQRQAWRPRPHYILSGLCNGALFLGRRALGRTCSCSL